MTDHTHTDRDGASLRIVSRPEGADMAPDVPAARLHLREPSVDIEQDRAAEMCQHILHAAGSDARVVCGHPTDTPVSWPCIREPGHAGGHMAVAPATSHVPDVSGGASGRPDLDATAASRDRIIAALRKQGAWCGDCDFETDTGCDGCAHVLSHYADAVMEEVGPEMRRLTAERDEARMELHHSEGTVRYLARERTRYRTAWTNARRGRAHWRKLTKEWCDLGATILRRQRTDSPDACTVCGLAPADQETGPDGACRHSPATRIDRPQGAPVDDT